MYDANLLVPEEGETIYGQLVSWVLRDDASIEDVRKVLAGYLYLNENASVPALVFADLLNLRIMDDYTCPDCGGRQYEAYDDVTGDAILRCENCDCVEHLVADEDFDDNEDDNY